MNRVAMGNESSQLAKDGTNQRSGGPERIGPSISPTPEPEDSKLATRVNSPALSPLAPENPDGQPSKKRKKKKHRKSFGSDAASLQGEEAAQEEADVPESTKKSKRKKSRKKEPEPEPEPAAEEDNAVVKDTQPEPRVDAAKDDPPSPKPKKKRSKKYASRDDECPLPNGIHVEALVNGNIREGSDEVPSQSLPGLHSVASDIISSSKQNSKKRRKNAGGTPSSEASQQLPILHEEGGSPPSAQPPRIAHVSKYEPLPEDDEEDESIDVSQLKREMSDDDDMAVNPFSQLDQPGRQETHVLTPSQISQTSKLPQASFAGTAVANFAEALTDPVVAESSREQDTESVLGWLHKRENAPQEMPITDPRTAQQIALDASQPDLQPHQVKTETGSDSDSETDSSTESESSSELDSHSPSAQRSERLSRSRSRSASRAPSRSGFLADRALGISAAARPDPYAQVPYSAPSSTGSNRSIPNRLPSPSSTGSNRSIPARLEPEYSPTRPESSKAQRASESDRNDAHINGGGMDMDSPAVPNSSLPKKRANAKKATPAKKKIAPLGPSEVSAIKGDEALGNHVELAHDEALPNGDAMDIDDPAVDRSNSLRPKRATRAGLGRKNKAAQSTQPEVAEVADDPIGTVDAAHAGVADEHETSPNGDVPDTPAKRIPSPVAKRAKKASLGRNTKVVQPAQTDAPAFSGQNVEAAGAGAVAQAAGSDKQNRKRQSQDALSDSNPQVMSSWLRGSARDIQHAGEFTANGAFDDELPLDDMPFNEMPTVEPARQLQKPAKRKPKPSLVQDEKLPSAAEDDGISHGAVEYFGTVPATEIEKGQERAHRDSAPIDAPEAHEEHAADNRDANLVSSAFEAIAATRDDSIEPGESASQPQPKPKPKSKPKGKRLRVLGQRKMPSLSQLEGDEDEDDFSETFSRRTSTKQPPTGSRKAPGQGEAIPSQIADSLPPSPEKPRKKRKRPGAHNASEDEMESLLAAGPSKGRKSATKLGFGENEGHKGKRKRLASAGGGKASGPWSKDELHTLKMTVDEFRDENGMTEFEINKLIHEVPNKTDALNQEFWDRANVALPQRTRKQITERARRKFHNFAARATWTDEQKEEVHELFESHPKKWAEIAVIINRDQKDVRDYWRNHYLVLESQIKSRWSREEEVHLTDVVEEALHRIRVKIENNDQVRSQPRTTLVDDEALLDWQQISEAMDRTRSRQQCRWKWIDMRERGLVGEDSIKLPTQPRDMVNGISQDLANAREDYRGMGPEERFRLVDAIKDSEKLVEKDIPWRSLVDESFRLKWHRPTLRLVWYRLRQTVPNYENQDVNTNARHLVNSYHMHHVLPGVDDHQVEDQVEESIVNYVRGKRIWKRPSLDLRATRERQRRSSSATSRASSRSGRSVSGEILNLSGDEERDDDEALPSGSRQSTELGEERGRRPRRAAIRSDGIDVTIPGHLQGESAKKSLELARARAKGKRTTRALNLGGEAGGPRGARSNSVAVDSESDL